MEENSIQNEVDCKLVKVRDYMKKKDLIGIKLSRRDNFAWITGGKDNHVVNSSEAGFVSLLVTDDQQFLVTDNVEKFRILNEELFDSHWVPLEFEWYDPDGVKAILRKVLGSGKLASDDGMSGTQPLDSEFDELRYSLLPIEIQRYRIVCSEGAQILEGTCYELKPGMTEHEIAALLAQKAVALGFESSARLIGTDERIRLYRHPIPTTKKLDKHALVVFLGQRWGLYINASRVVHFGKPPQDLIHIHKAACYVDAVYLSNMSPGTPYKKVFFEGAKAYAEMGYPEEWKRFTQGGVIGYKPREFVVTPETNHYVLAHQAVAWNPTVTGSKCEDTTLVVDGGTDVLSEMKNWPILEFDINGKIIRRPDILIR